jgi:hypothetical protein
VKNVILQTSWQEGRRIAEEVLLEFSLASPFALMDAGASYDILCPFSKNKMVLVDKIIAPGAGNNVLFIYKCTVMTDHSVVHAGL